MSRSISAGFRRVAVAVSNAMGTPWAFFVALAIIIVWAALGPLADFSETWQLVVNTATTIITFLMVFVVQTTQNRDAKAIHLKLDELIRTTSARNAFADLEDADDEELERLHAEFVRLRRHADDALEAIEEKGGVRPRQ